jgi:hypothetical protein
MSEDQKFSRSMTVAQVREQKGVDYVEVIFLESARFYRLLKENPAFDEILASLRDAESKGRPVEVRLASLGSEVIEDVRPASSAAE